MSSRRGFLRNILAGAGAIASVKVLSAQEMDMSHGMEGMKMKDMKKSEHGHVSPTLVETPDVAQLPWRMEETAKKFHLIADPAKQKIVPGRGVKLWGYTGDVPAPMLHVT